VLLKKIAILASGLFTICAAGAVSAQTQPPNASEKSPQQAEVQPAPADPQQAQAAPAAAAEKEVWKGPFGGTFTATFAFATDYSYRGISQTQRQVAFQPAVTYETAPVSANVPLTAYVGAWGSNVYFGNTNPTIAEIDLITGLRLKALDDKLTFDLGYIRYNYLGAPADLFYDFNEFGLVVGYDFGVAQLQGAVRYSPNFFANSGVAWYKWAQLSVPLSFININENVAFKVFGTIGNQSVQRFANYGIPSNNYWDWQLGLTATVWGVDLTIAYVDTNVDVNGCLGTQNCAARAIFTISKTF
jgi:uncharacterized protein (TIGR02001 family)